MTRSSFARMLLRAAVRRCPWCGGRHAFFTGWFSKQSHCGTCGLRWRRGDVGFELGAASMAAIITLGPLVLALAIVLAVTWPDAPVVPLMAVFMPSAVLLPMVTYPLSYTMWQAVDLAMRPATADDFDAAFILDDVLPRESDKSDE